MSASKQKNGILRMINYSNKATPDRFKKSCDYVTGSSKTSAELMLTHLMDANDTLGSLSALERRWGNHQSQGASKRNFELLRSFPLVGRIAYRYTSQTPCPLLVAYAQCHYGRKIFPEPCRVDAVQTALPPFGFEVWLAWAKRPQ